MLSMNHWRKEGIFEQLDLFTDYSHMEEEQQKRKEKLEREKKLQHAALDIKKKFGKNALLKGMNLEKGLTAVERNSQIGELVQSIET